MAPGGFPTGVSIWFDAEKDGALVQAPHNYGSLGGSGIMGDNLGDTTDDPIPGDVDGNLAWYFPDASDRVWKAPSGANELTMDNDFVHTFFIVMRQSGVSSDPLTRYIGGMMQDTGENAYQIGTRRIVIDGARNGGLWVALGSTARNTEYVMHDDNGTNRMFAIRCSGTLSAPLITIAAGVYSRKTKIYDFTPLSMLTGVYSSYVGASAGGGNALDDMGIVAWGLYERSLTDTEMDNLIDFYETDRGLGEFVV